MSKIKVNQIVPFNKDGVSIGPPINDPSVAFSIQSTTQGVVFPRHTTEQRDAIVNPIDGLIIYNTDTNILETFDGESWANPLAGELNQEIADRIAGQEQLTSDLNEEIVERIAADEVTLATSQAYTNNRFDTAERLVVQKNAGQGEFFTVSEALASITDNSASKPYSIRVYPGIYLEPTLVMKPYVSITGEGQEVSIIKAAAPNQHLIIGCDFSEITNVTLTGVSGTGYALVYQESLTGGSSTGFYLTEVRLGSADILVHSHGASSGSSTVFVTDCKFGSIHQFNKGFIATNDPTFNRTARIAILHSASTGMTAPYPSCFASAVGVNTEIVMNGVQCRTGGLTTSHGILADSGGSLRLLAVNLRGFGQAIKLGNSGAAPKVVASAINPQDCTVDLEVLHPNATGYVQGPTEYAKIKINPSSKVFVPGKDLNIITVAKRGGDFESVAAAVASIVDATISNRYVVQVGPGVFVEDTVILKPYVSLKGSDAETTILRASNPANSVIYGAAHSRVDSLTVEGSTDVGVYAIRHSSPNSDYATFTINDCIFGENYGHVETYADQGETNAFVVACKYGKPGSFTRGFLAHNNPAHNAPSQLFLHGSASSFGMSSRVEIFARASGINCQLITNSIGVRTTNGGDVAFQAEDGATLRMVGTNIRGWDKGIEAVNSGAAPTIVASGINFEANDLDVDIEHTGTTGSLIGNSIYSKIYIHPSSTFYIAGKDRKAITVAKAGGDFSSVAAAINQITDAGPTNSYVVRVGPGIFVEPTITMKPFVSVVGENASVSTIWAADPAQPVIVGAPFSSINGVTIAGATSSYGVFYEPTYTSGVFAVQNCTLDGNQTQAYATAANPSLNGALAIRSSSLGYQPFTNGFVVDNINNAPIILAVSDLLFDLSVNPPAKLFKASGLGTLLSASGVTGRSNGTGTCVEFFDGTQLRLQNFGARGFATGLLGSNVGAASSVAVLGILFEQCTNDITILHPGNFGSITGSVEKSKTFLATSGTISISYSDPTSNGFVSVGQLFLGDTHSTTVDVRPLLEQGSPLGLISGGLISANTGLSVTAGAGFGYTTSGTVIKRHDWADSEITLSPNTSNYIFINSDGIPSVTSTPPTNLSNIHLGRAVTNSTEVEFLDITPFNASHASNRTDEFNRAALGAIYTSGSIVTEAGTRNLTITGGQYYFSGNKFSPAGMNGGSFLEHYRGSGSAFNRNLATVVDNARYDSGGGTLTTISDGNYVKHTLYTVGQGANEKYLLVYGQVEFTNLTLAEQGNIPTAPNYFEDGVVLIASIIVRGDGNSTNTTYPNIIQIRDERPVIGFKSSGVSASSTHGNLLGLNADDHTQYLLASGARAMSGSLNMGGNSITNSGTINAVDITSHATRHLPNGADPLATAAPSTLGANVTQAVGIANSLARSDHGHAINTAAPVTVGTANAAGTSNSLARADHVHNHGAQTDATHHAVATTSANGFMSSADKTKLDTVGANANVTSVNSKAGVVSLATTDIPEGTNLYYTDGRADGRIDLQKGAAGGLVPLDSVSKIPASFLPAIAITDTFVVTSQAQMLALTAETGDVAIRTDLNTSFILQGSNPAVIGGWVELVNPGNTAIQTVNGKAGPSVTLSTTDVSEGSSLYFTNARSIASALTGFTSSPGTVGPTDSILQAFQKLNGNISLRALDSAVVKTVNGVSPTTGAVTITTSNIAEGSSLYYTQARFDSALAGKSTSNLTEGSNLYFTNARAIAAPLNGFNAGTGTVTSTDSIITAIQKNVGNIALKYDASNPNGYETPAQLNARDTSNRSRANHTGTQLASTISDFAANVLSTVLTGLSTATSSAITAADSVLSALGKLQAQITSNAAAIATKLTASNNLSDLTSATTARSNLGFGSTVFGRVRSRLIGSAAIGAAGSTTFIAAGDKFLWIQSRNISYKNGIIMYRANIGNRNLEVRLVDTVTSAVLGVSPTISASGVYTFTVTSPTADTVLELQIRQTSSGGSSPSVDTAVIEFDTI